VRLCESFFLDEPGPPGRAANQNGSEGSHDRLRALRSALLALADDPSPRVRFQLALTLGELPSEASLEALAQLCPAAPRTAGQSLAVLSSVSGAPWSFLQRWRAFIPTGSPRRLRRRPGFLQDLSALVGAAGAPEDVQECSSWLAQAGAPAAERLALLAGLADGLARPGTWDDCANPASVSLRSSSTPRNSAGPRRRPARAPGRPARAGPARGRRAQPVLLTLLLPAPAAGAAVRRRRSRRRTRRRAICGGAVRALEPIRRATRQQLLQSARIPPR